MNTATILSVLALFLSFISAILYFQTSSRFRRMKRRYEKLLRGSEDLALEEILNDHADDLMSLKNRAERQDARMKVLSRRILTGLSHRGFLAYNAFEGTVGKRSYSMCLLDDYKNGFIFTGLFGVDRSMSYGKEIIGGKSATELSPEEEIVLGEALADIRDDA